MSVVNPKSLLDMNYAFAQTALLVAAVRLHIFTSLAQKAMSSKSLAEVSKTSPKATERLLKGLQVLGLVEQTDDCYQLTPLAAQFLVEGKPSYLGGDTLAMLDYLPAWLQLDHTVQTNLPYRDLGQAQVAEEFFAPRVRDLFPLVYPLASRLAAILDLGERDRSLQVLDVGAGSAAWSAAFAQHYPKAQVTAIDLPAVVVQGRQQIDSLQLSHRYRWIEADLANFHYPRNEYDLILLAHVCRFIGDEQTQQMMAQLCQSLRPSGVLVLADVFFNEDGVSPASAVTLDLSMMVNTSCGRVRSVSEYQDWLERCGLQQVRSINVNGPFPLIIATKGAATCAELS